MKSKTTLYLRALSSIGGDKPFIGIPAKSKGGATPPKQNSPPNNGFPPPREGRTHPERVVTAFKNLNENAHFYFYTSSRFVKYLNPKIV